MKNAYEVEREMAKFVWIIFYSVIGFGMLWLFGLI